MSKRPPWNDQTVDIRGRQRLLPGQFRQRADRDAQFHNFNEVHF
jgi:hypothetical protein